MASSDTLVVFDGLSNRYQDTNLATLVRRNGHDLLAFDDTTQELAIFEGVLPSTYAGGGLTVLLHWAAASATSGTIGWDVAVERIGDSQQDIDSDGFASARTVTATTVPGTSGYVDITSVAFTSGAQMDSLAAGEAFRIRVRRDVATDTATGDAQLLMVAVEES